MTTPQAGAVFLVGGGWDPEAIEAVYSPFVRAAAALADRACPRIAVLLVVEHPDAELADRWTRVLAAAGDCTVDVTSIIEGEAMPEVAGDVDGIVVGGGLTPAYLDAIAPIAESIRSRVAYGVPYLGFSAGAAIAAERAILGGWRIDGVQMGVEDAAEELDELEIRQGLALVDFAVDVHAAQWGTLGRLVSAVDARRLERGSAIDENTVLIVRGADRRVGGAGRVWSVDRAGGGARIRIDRAHG